MSSQPTSLPKVSFWLFFFLVLITTGACSSAVSISELTGEAIIQPEKQNSVEIESIPAQTLAKIQPQPADVYHNRVNAFIQAYDLLDLIETLAEDQFLNQDELIAIRQLAANARASFYNTGDHQVFIYAELITQINNSLVPGKWTEAQIKIQNLRGQLPRRPSSGK